MRAYLKLSKSNNTIPFNYQVNLVGALHKWVGLNYIHDDVSLYSFSWLRRGRIVGNKGLYFPEGADWFISVYNADYLKKIVNGILDDPRVAFGMEIVEMTLCETPEFGVCQKFTLGSPVFIKRSDGTRQRHFTFKDEEADVLMTKTLQNKLKKAGLPYEEAKVRFDRNYQSAKTKMCNYRGVDNKVNYCPVIVEGSSEQIGFAWEVGVGNSTGIGFGSLV